MMLGADHSDPVFNTIILRDSHPTWLLLKRGPLRHLGSTLHAAGPNVTSKPRRGVVVSYCLGWLKPYENQWLVYPPDVARDFDPEVAALVGYRQHRPNLGNYEGQCPSRLLEDDPPARIGAVDALRPDQQALAAAHDARQRG